MVCFEWAEAEAIEASLSCGCPHKWETFAVENNFAVDEHARAGWTVGLSASGVPCLDICPPELLDLVERQRAAAAVYEIEAERVDALLNGPPRNDIAPDEVTFWHNVKMLSSAARRGTLKRRNAALHMAHR